MSRRPSIGWLALTLALALTVCAAALAADRTDPSFASKGVATVPLPEVARKLRAAVVVEGLAAAGGGRIAVALGDFSGNQTYIAAARFLPNGRPDPGFGDAGFAEAVGLREGVVTGLRYSQAQAVAVQKDGKVVLAGYSAPGFGLGKVAPVLVRFRADGSLDPSFGDAGVVAPSTKGAGDEALHAVAILRGGRIVGVGGKHEQHGRPGAVVIGYRPNGRIDRSFGRNGRLLFSARRGRNLYTGFKAVRALPSGKLLVAGYRQGRLFVVRLTPSGRLDRGFGRGGAVSLGIGANRGCVGDCGLATPIAIQPDSRILIAAGLTSDYSVLVRLRSGGALDRRFGRDGRARTGKRYFLVQGLAVDRRGRPLLAGLGERAISPREVSIVFAVYRFSRRGHLDRRFGHGGIQKLAIGESSAALAALAQPSGRIVAAGGAQFSGGGHRLLLTRYLDAP